MRKDIEKSGKLFKIFMLRNGSENLIVKQSTEGLVEGWLRQGRECEVAQLWEFFQQLLSPWVKAQRRLTIDFTQCWGGGVLRRVQ